MTVSLERLAVLSTLPTLPTLPTLAALLHFACAGHVASPPAPATTPFTMAADPVSLQPPALVAVSATTPTDPKHPDSARSELRRSIFVAAWETVRDKHYDKTLGGLAKPG